MMKKSVMVFLAVAFAAAGCGEKTGPQRPYVLPAVTENGEVKTVERKFISHRGVDMGCTVAGENSLEAIKLAADLKFDCIETDVRETSDGVLVCMHDVTLNRTCLNADGSKIEAESPVKDFTLDQLKNDFIIKAARENMRSQIPTLTQYLQCCKENGIFPFIEPKITDESGEMYRRIMAEADPILGRDGYIITSNNRANEIIRGDLGVKDVKLMSILYQTTFEKIESLGNCIMAISATRYAPEEYAGNVSRAVSAGLETESSADKFVNFDMINKAQINYISTDYLLPDYRGQGTLVCDIKEPSKWSTLPKEEQTFGAYFLEMTYKGSAEVTLGRQTFKIGDGNGIKDQDGYSTISYQLLMFQEVPVAKLTATSADFTVKASQLRFVKFE